MFDVKKPVYLDDLKPVQSWFCVGSGISDHGLVYHCQVPVDPGPGPGPWWDIVLPSMSRRGGCLGGGLGLVG